MASQSKIEQSRKAKGSKGSTTVTKLKYAAPVKASSTIAQGNVTKDISLTNPDATIAEWCYDSQVLFHMLPSNMHIPEQNVESIVVRTLDKARMSHNFLYKLDPEAPNDRESLKTAINPDMKEAVDEDLTRAIKVFGGEDRLIAFVKEVYDDAHCLKQRESALQPKETEWRHRTWDKILLKCERLFLRNDPLPEDRAEPPSHEDLKGGLFQEPVLNYHRMPVLDGKEKKGKNIALQVYQDALTAHKGSLNKAFTGVQPEDPDQDVLDIVADLGTKQMMVIKQDEASGPKVSKENLMRRVSVYPDSGIADAVWAYKDLSYWNMLRGRFRLSHEAARDIARLTEWVQTKQDASGQFPLLLPLLVVENKKTHGGIPREKEDGGSKGRQTADPERVGRNQRLLYCISASRFLNELGITCIPTFGLSTTGAVGTLCFTWASKLKRNRGGEQNAPVSGGPYNIALNDTSSQFRYDLTKKIDIVQFVAFLFKLRRTYDAMNQAITSAESFLDPLVRKLQSDPTSSWHLSKQIEKHNIPRLSKAEAAKLQKQAEEEAKAREAERKAEEDNDTGPQQGDEGEDTTKKQ